MAYYHKLGNIPKKKHTTFKKGEKKTDLYYEELYSTKGFSGVYSNKYHINMPTQVLKIEDLPHTETVNWDDAPLQYYHFQTDKKKSDGDFISARASFLENENCVIATAKVTENTDKFFRNAYSHEMIFVHHGSGEFLSEYGKIAFEDGDYLVIPKGSTYHLNFSDFKNNKLFIVESKTAFEIPNKYKNEYGQLMEWAPYCERDFRAPEFVEPVDQEATDKKPINLILKADKKFYNYSLKHHPFDLVGWDGFAYPYAFNIKEFSPVVGKIHLPPPVHQVFQTEGFVVCNFVPRLFDFHPEAIPAPYYHSNVDSDEVLYYVEGEFMSRKGVGEGSITLHPGGIPHGPQPGKYEASVGKKDCYEYAVMVDTFSPLKPTLNVKETMLEDYSQSWLTK